MVRYSYAALFALAFLPNIASALEIKNARPCYMAFGASRYDTKYIPGDVVFMTYDIENLGLDPKTKRTGYITILELVDPLGKVVFKNESPLTEVMPQLGGTRMPGDLHVILGPKQSPGQYAVKLTVVDKVGKDAKAIEYKFTVLPEEFGFVGVSAAAVGFPGQRYVTGMALVNMTLDAKKQPNVEMIVKVLDSTGAVVSPPVQILLPRDLPETADLAKANFVEMPQIIYLNRVGRFTIEVTATDNLAKKTTKLQYKLNVLDLNTIVGQ